MDIEINEREKIRKKINELKKRLEEISEEGEGRARAKGREYAQMVRERGRESYERARMAGGKIDEYAHEHPWVWMGLGVLIGVTLGASASMKACKKRYRQYCE
jgi:ElaB/YqjD/DUF883 family membrane-anchored ribosome-binding protein